MNNWSREGRNVWMELQRYIWVMWQGESQMTWSEVRWNMMGKMKSTLVDLNMRKWSNSLLLFLLCSAYSKTERGHECWQWLSSSSSRGSPLSKAEDELYEDATTRHPPALYSPGSSSAWGLCQHRWLGGGGQPTIASYSSTSLNISESIVSSTSTTTTTS